MFIYLPMHITQRCRRMIAVLLLERPRGLSNLISEGRAAVIGLSYVWPSIGLLPHAIINSMLNINSPINSRMRNSSS